MRRDIEVEDIHRQTHGRTRVRNVNDTRDMALHWSARQQEVDLVIIVTCAER